MPDRVTLDVIDRPAGGLRGVMGHARSVRASGEEALRALLVLGTGRFVTRVRPAPTPRRVALLGVWDDGVDVDGCWTAALGALAADARECWHVEAELVRAAFTGPWKGWTPDVAGARPLDPSEPAVTIISGDLHARHLPAFMRDVPGAVAHALAQPGYLGGLPIINSPVNTTSVSCWRTYQDARDYAFGPGAHVDAMRRDRAAERHRTEWFVRLRPLLERGSLTGTAPLAPVLAQPAAPTT